MIIISHLIAYISIIYGNLYIFINQNDIVYQNRMYLLLYNLYKILYYYMIFLFLNYIYRNIWFISLKYYLIK